MSDAASVAYNETAKRLDHQSAATGGGKTASISKMFPLKRVCAAGPGARIEAGSVDHIHCTVGNALVDFRDEDRYTAMLRLPRFYNLCPSRTAALLICLKKRPCGRRPGLVPAVDWWRLSRQMAGGRQLTVVGVGIWRNRCSVP